MTTSQVNSIIQHTSDAEFRAWGSQIRDQLLAIGLTKTADTGQIDWTTVARPGTNTAAGYEIWRFNDALQATKPIFFKVEYGTSASAAIPEVWLTVGGGSNGTGTITGTSFSRRQVGRTLTPTTVSNPSYACYSPAAGGFMFVGWSGSAGAPASLCMSAFGIWRSCDDDGTPNGDGYSVYYLATTQLSAVMWSIVNNVVSAPANSAFALIPGYVIASAVGADANVYKHFMSVPRMRPALGMLTYHDAEIGKGTTFSLATFGATVHTFLALGNGLYGTTAGQPSHTIAMLWE